jgi:hypothetical protein
MPVTTLSSLRWQRPIYVALLVVIATTIFLNIPRPNASEFFIFIPAMLLSAMGLALGSHLVMGDRVPPTLGRLAGAAFTGGLAGALLFIPGIAAGAALANTLGLKRPEGLEWGVFFFPFWIFFSGGSAIFGRYLGWRFLGNRLVAAIGAGVLGALVGDTVMTFTIFWPFAVGPDYLHAPIAMTATFGALVAAGLAWAERKVSCEHLTTSETSATED